jgi:hypothetical protein
MTLTLVPTRARAALPAFGLLLALTGGSVVVHADEEDATATLESAETCSNASLHGTYGFSFHRVNLNPDGTRASEFAGVGVETLDGHGAITSGRLMSVFGGQPSALTFTGTYSVNADCTGTKTITINGQPSHYALILVDDARQIETAETDAGTLLAFPHVRQ